MFNEIKKLLSGNLHTDCISLFKAYDKNIVLNHTLSVANKAKEIGKQFNLNSEKLETAAYLHDISVIIPREQYEKICKEFSEEVIELEIKLPILLHQKVSKIIAEEIFNITDNEILSAISCHTTLKATPSKIDMALFIADKLKWDQGGNPPYKELVETALVHSLEKACLAYIDYIIENNMILIPHPILLDAKEYLEN